MFKINVEKRKLIKPEPGMLVLWDTAKTNLQYCVDIPRLVHNIDEYNMVKVSLQNDTTNKLFSLCDAHTFGIYVAKGELKILNQ